MLSFEIPVQREDLLGESNNNNNKYRIESLQWLDNLSENQMMKELDRVYNEIKNDGKMIETNSRNFEALFGCLRYAIEFVGIFLFVTLFFFFR